MDEPHSSMTQFKTFEPICQAEVSMSKLIKHTMSILNGSQFIQADIKNTGYFYVNMIKILLGNI